MNSLTRVSRTIYSSKIVRLWTPCTYQIANMSDRSTLDKDGPVGSAFKEDGSLGGTAQKLGGPFDKKGAIGEQFTTEGAVGGTAQSTAETVKGQKPSALDAQGMIGEKFTPEGAIGGTAQKIGGPLDKDGMIGSMFKQDGALGGTVQSAFGDKK